MSDFYEEEVIWFAIEYYKLLKEKSSLQYKYKTLQKNYENIKKDYKSILNANETLVDTIVRDLRKKLKETDKYVRENKNLIDDGIRKGIRKRLGYEEGL